MGKVDELVFWRDYSAEYVVGLKICEPAHIVAYEILWKVLLISRWRR